MSSEEEEINLLDPKTDRKIKLWISSIIALLFTICAVDLQGNLRFGEKIAARFLGDE